MDSATLAGLIGLGVAFLLFVGIALAVAIVFAVLFKWNMDSTAKAKRWFDKRFPPRP